MNFDPCSDKAEKAFLEYLRSEAPAACAGYEMVGSKRHAEFPVPGIIFSASEDEVKERVPGRGIFDVPLDIYIGTNSEVDPEGHAHSAAVGAVIAHLNDKAAVRAALNSGAGRPVTDFHVYDYLLRGQPTRAIAAGTWETIIKLTVICQGIDG